MYNGNRFACQNDNQEIKKNIVLAKVPNLKFRVWLSFSINES